MLKAAAALVLVAIRAGLDDTPSSGRITALRRDSIAARWNMAVCLCVWSSLLQDPVPLVKGLLGWVAGGERGVREVGGKVARQLGQS